MKRNRWFYVGMGVLILLFAGMVYAWSVMSGPIAAEFTDWSKAQLSMTFTIVMICFCLGGMIGGIITPIITARLSIWLSAALFAAGMILTSRTQSLPTLYMGFGVICGLAAGISYNAIMSTVGKWFPDKQGLVSGVLLMGFGFSSFLIGKVYQAVTPETIGAWRLTFVVLGVITAGVLAVCGFFVRKPTEDWDAPAPKKAGKKKANPLTQDVSTFQMVRRQDFWFFYLWAILLSAAGLMVVSQASSMVSETGAQVSGGTVATIVGLISIFNGVGRVIFGQTFDMFGRKVVMMLNNLLYIATGAVLVLALSTKNLQLIIIGFILCGLSYGGVPPINSAQISTRYGMKHYPLNFSVVNTNLIFASFGSTIAGALFDLTGSYRISCILIIVMAVVGIAVTLRINAIDRRELALIEAEREKAEAAKAAAVEAENRDVF